jgi:nitrate/TMAO reductase-like tetraheme cytochrome c subunit
MTSPVDPSGAGPAGEVPAQGVASAETGPAPEAAPAPEPDAATTPEAGTAPDAIDPAVAALAAASAAAVPAKKRRFPRIRIPHPPLRSKRGLLIVGLLGAGLAVAFTVTGVVAIQWTETADFCGRCHTMGPELKAYEMSPHRDVSCAECHVEPGIQGWVKAKINGTKQLVEIITGQFPKPIPAPDHAELPPTSSSCQKCHAMSSITANGGPIRLVLNNRYAKDEQNSLTTVATVVRPNGFGGGSDVKGVHWHVVSDVEYLRADPRAQKIDYIQVTNPDGTVEEFLASDVAQVPTDVQPDIDHLKATETMRRMDCIDCHNRVGHGIPSVDQSIDSDISAGHVSTSLPYVKQQASQILGTEYASTGDAHAAIDGLRNYYSLNYPAVVASDGVAIDTAIETLKTTYDLVATPDMRVTAATYPNNLGHQTAPGCFRCHDGAHYKVVDGALTNEAIPFGCATCHTFPQIGAQTSGVLIGQRPPTHDNKLWIFDHKTAVSTVDPSNTACGACHTRTYCENCHNTKAVQVPHDNMIIDHAQVTRKVGAQTCAYCHSPAYCAQCHGKDPVMPNQWPDATPATGGTGGTGSGGRDVTGWKGPVLALRPWEATVKP